MRIYVIPTQTPPYPKDTDGMLYNLQNLVGGFIETVYLPELEEKNILLVANEEGVLRGLPVNVNLLPYFFVGQLFAVGRGEEDFVSLTPDQEDYLRKWLSNLG